MFKALLKKQLLEHWHSYFINRKTGKKRSTLGVIGYIILFVFIFATLAGMFFGMDFMLADALLGSDLLQENSGEWVYFALGGMMAILLGTFGSAFNTFTSMYLAKDNELLLSMPIPPSKILLSRIVDVYLLSLLYSAIAWVPCFAAAWIVRVPTVTGVVFPLLLTFVIALFVTVFTCLVGWVIALIAGKLKNKSFITVFVTLALLGVYYFICFRVQNILTSIIADAGRIGATIKMWLYPVYLLAKAGQGETLPILAFTAISVALFALTWWILSRSFIKLATQNRGEKKAEYREQTVKVGTPKKALFTRERKRFTSSATYMLNTALGVIFMPAVTVVLWLKSSSLDTLRETIDLMMPGLSALLPIAVTVVFCTIMSMDVISTPSVALEGKNLWIVRSLPVRTADILHAKTDLHFYVNAIPAAISVFVCGLIIGVEIYLALLMAITAALFARYTANVGLLVGLNKPNLKWTSETAPIKQDIGVLVSILIGFLSAIAILAGGYFTRFLRVEQYFIAIIVLLALLSRVLNIVIDKKGVEIFESL